MDRPRRLRLRGRRQHESERRYPGRRRELTNTATVTPPSGLTDPQSGNNSSTTTTTPPVTLLRFEVE